MQDSLETPIARNAPESQFAVPSHNDWETWTIRALLAALVLGELVSVLAPRISGHWLEKAGVVQQTSMGLAILALVLYLHLASQRKLLGKVSTALMAATTYVDRLEQVSLIDTNTQLFNRKYLDHLFNQHLKWLTRNSKPATLLLFDLLPNGETAPTEEIVMGAAYILQANFRGSDYIVRYSTNRFLVVMPDTNQQQAQIALSRLIDKVEHWNRTNEQWEMALRLEFGVCPPGGNFWAKLSEIEVKVGDNSDPGRALILRRPAAHEAAAPVGVPPQEPAEEHRQEQRVH